jgi:hypothetical protein
VALDTHGRMVIADMCIKAKQFMLQEDEAGYQSKPDQSHVKGLITNHLEQLGSSEDDND